MTNAEHAAVLRRWDSNMLPYLNPDVRATIERTKWQGRR